MSESNTKPVVGAQIPDRLFQLINLQSFSKSISKSQIVRDALLLYFEQNEVSIDQIIQEIVKEYKTRWLRVKNNEKNTSFSEFLQRSRKEMESEKVAPYLIDQIIKNI